MFRYLDKQSIKGLHRNGTTIALARANALVAKAPHSTKLCALERVGRYLLRQMRSLISKRNSAQNS